MPLNKIDMALYQEMLAEQKARQAHAKMLAMVASLTKQAVPYNLYEYDSVEAAYDRAFGRKSALPEPEFSLEELESAQKIIDDLA